MRILTIGDIHGEDNWSKLGDIEKLLTKDNAVPEYDKYIFVGDYVDSFHKTNNEIYLNLQKIIEFKLKYMEHVVLLWGNHDNQYVVGQHLCYCSGFRPEAKYDLLDLFEMHLLLFQTAFQIGNNIWTHAGISQWWYDNRYLRFFDSEKNIKHNLLTIENDDHTLADNLNTLYEYHDDMLFDVGYRRGGHYKTGGPFWIDKTRLIDDPLKGYNQIVGHTHVKDIEVENTKDGHKLVFVDCLQNKTSCYLSNS